MTNNIKCSNCGDNNTKYAAPTDTAFCFECGAITEAKTGKKVFSTYIHKNGPYNYSEDELFLILCFGGLVITTSGKIEKLGNIYKWFEYKNPTTNEGLGLDKDKIQLLQNRLVEGDAAAIEIAKKLSQNEQQNLMNVLIRILKLHEEETVEGVAALIKLAYIINPYTVESFIEHFSKITDFDYDILMEEFPKVNLQFMQASEIIEPSDDENEEESQQNIKKEIMKNSKYPGKTAIEGYFNERPNIARIFDELNFSLIKGDTVEKYLNQANLMRDSDTRRIVSQGFSDISVFLEELESDVNILTRKDKAINEEFKNKHGEEMPEGLIGTFILYPEIKEALREAKELLNKDDGTGSQVEQLNRRLFSISESWNSILTSRASWRTMSIEKLNFSYWDMAIGHTEEYMLKYEEDRMDVEGITYRIDTLNLFISEYEKYFESCIKSNTKISEDVNNKFFAVVESLIGAELTLVKMVEAGENYDTNLLYNRKDRPNSETINDVNETNTDFEDIMEYTFHKGCIYNGWWNEVNENNVLLIETPFRFGLKHGVEKRFHENGTLKMEILYFNDKSVEILSEFDEDGKILTSTDKISEIEEEKNPNIDNSKEEGDEMFSKNKDILNVFSGFTDIQKTNIKISVFISAVWQLINADGKITKEESAKFLVFAKNVSGQYLGSTDDKDDPVIAELLTDADMMIEVIKSYPEEELNSFWDTLFSFALVDNDFSVEEANFIGSIAGAVYEDLSDDEVRSWMTDQINMQKDSGSKVSESFKNNLNNPITAKKSPPKQAEKKPRKYKIYIFLILLLLIFGACYLFFVNKVDNFKSLILPTIERNELVNKDAEKNKWESKFRKDYPRLKSYYVDSKSNEDEKLNFDDAIIKRDTTISFLFFSNNLKFNALDRNYFECAYYHEINRYDKKYNKEFLSWFKKTRRKHKIKESKLNELIRFVKNNPENASFPFDNIENDFDKNCVKCISNYISSIELNQDAITDFDNFVKSYLKNDKLARTFSAQSFIDFMDDLEKLEENMSKSVKKTLRNKASKKKPNAITLFGLDGGIPKKYPYLYKRKSQYEFKDLKELGKINYSLTKEYYKKSVLRKLVDDLKKEINESYKNNSLYTGAQPYSYCYGRNPSCSIPDGYAECSFIDVQASSSGDVIVIIKKNNKVYSHAYIKAGGYYKFKLGNGMFQTFFYYGKGWNPEKLMKKTICGDVTGGFVSSEKLNKSDPIYLNHSTMSYTLYGVDDGNFEPEKSNKNEAF